MCYMLSRLVTSYVSHFLGKCCLCICSFLQKEFVTHPHRAGSHDLWPLAVSYKVTESIELLMLNHGPWGKWTVSFL